MKKHFWKTEYSITLFIAIAIALIIIPPPFISSKGAAFVSEWNETYDNIEYMFTAITAQADENLVRGIKNAVSNEKREEYMLQIIKPYFRLSEDEKLKRRYSQSYMNGLKVKNGDEFYFSDLYDGENGLIVGIKDIKNEDNEYSPWFAMMFDINGKKGPNMWGADVYGIRVYAGGSIRPIGSDMNIAKLKKDCSKVGTGTTCSYYYRIGGEFNE